ncbi:MAG: hypothetical protein ACFHWZ_06235 [Phycisphaerales bacterium]
MRMAARPPSSAGDAGGDDVARVVDVELGARAVFLLDAHPRDRDELFAALPLVARDAPGGPGRAVDGRARRRVVLGLGLGLHQFERATGRCRGAQRAAR